jgi:AcrR family transcriptional regulator
MSPTKQLTAVQSVRKITKVPPPGDEATRLDRDAWLREAASAIAEDGFNGARVLPLSKRLGVTRGSFYWHFTDHADFVSALILRWRDQQLRAVSTFNPRSADPIQTYSELLEVVLKDSPAELRRLKVEFALRGHARRDVAAAKVVAEVDRARTELLLPLVRDIAASKDQAESYSRLLLIQISGAQHAIAGPRFDPKVLQSIKGAMVRSLVALYALRQSGR